MNSELLWSLFIKSSLVIVADGLFLLAIRKQSAALKHTVCLAAMLSILLLPVESIKLPSWNVPVEKTPILSPLMPPPSLRVESHIVSRMATPHYFTAPVKVMSDEHPLDFGHLLFLGWAIGVIAVLGGIALGLVKVLSLVRTGTEWKPFGDSDPLVPSRVRLLVCPNLPVPATAGVIRPLILMPVEAKKWDGARLRMVVGHEMAHIQRRDWLWQTLSQAVCAIYFYNPLVWLAARQLRKQSEYACDDYVLGMGIEPTAYAQELFDIAKRAKFTAAATVGMAKSRNVELRLKSIVDRHRNRRRISGHALTLALIGSFLAVAPVAILHVLPRDGEAIHGPRVHLPLIKWVQSEEVEPNVFLAKDGVAGLPNGFSVKLVGVGIDDKSALWDVEGKPVPNADLWRVGGVYWQGATFHGWSHGMPAAFSAFGRTMVVEVQSDADVAAAITSRIVRPAPKTQLQILNPSYAGGDDQVPEVNFKANEPAYARIDLGIASAASTGTYRFGIAGPDWHNEKVMQNPYFGAPGGVGRSKNGGSYRPDECGLQLSNKPVIYYEEAGGKYHQLDLLGDEVISPGLAIRALLFNKAGNRIELPEIPRFDTNGEPDLTMNATQFASIAKIVIQTSPYRWAEFRDISLKPKFEEDELHRLDPGIHGTAGGIAPGFSKTLKSGVAVSIESVTRAVSYEGQWKFEAQPSWRADGQVLANPPKLRDFGRETKVWGEYPLVEIRVGYAGLPEGASTSIAALGEVNPTFWLNGMFDQTNTLAGSITTSYLPSAKTGAVRIGVATGPWQTIDSQPIDIAQEPDAPTSDRRTRTGFELMLGTQPMLALDHRVIPLTKGELKGVAKRFVAVLKSGETQALIPGGRGQHGLEIYSIPARHGEFDEIYNHLIASDIKEVQLQTRPYEYVEFTGIQLNHR